MPSFLSLLQQTFGDTPVPDDNEIVVNGQLPQNSQDVPVPTNYDVLRRTQDISENSPERKGMFGVKGTLRDVLGLIGDSFLVGGGGNRIYQPTREREREADAMTGFTENPLASMERLAGAGFPKQAGDLYNNYLTNQYRQGQLASTENNRQDQQRDRAWTNYTQARTAIGQMFNSDAAKSNPELALQQAKIIADRAGIPLEEFFGENTEQLPSDLIDMFAKGAMTVNQQTQLPLAVRRVETAERNADTSERRANTYDRVSSPRNPPSTTEATEIARIRSRVNKGLPLSAGDEQTWKKYNEMGRSSTNGRRVVSPPSSGRFSPVR